MKEEFVESLNRQETLEKYNQARIDTMMAIEQLKDFNYHLAETLSGDEKIEGVAKAEVGDAILFDLFQKIYPEKK